MVKTIGLPLLLVAALAFCGIGFKFFHALTSLPSWSALPLVFLIVVFLHMYRNDKQFLYDIAPSYRWARVVIATEYVIVVMPFVLYQLWHSHLLIAALFLICSVLVTLLPHLKMRGMKPRPISLKGVPFQLYELKIIMERNFGLIFILWMAAFLGCVHVAFFLVSLLLSLSIFVSAFSYNEPLEIIGDNPFLLDEKLVFNTGFGLLLFLPQLLLTVFCNTESLLVIGYGIFYFVCIMCLAIVHKYAKYDPLRSVNVNPTLVSISMVLGLLPGLIIGSVFLVVFYYVKAKQNLNYYLC